MATSQEAADLTVVENRKKYLSGLTRKHKRCGSTMRIANVIAASRKSGDWPYFECKTCGFAAAL